MIKFLDGLQEMWLSASSVGSPMNKQITDTRRKGCNIPIYEHGFLFKLKKHLSNIINSVYVQGQQTQEIFKMTGGIFWESCPSQELLTSKSCLAPCGTTPWGFHASLVKICMLLLHTFNPQLSLSRRKISWLWWLELTWAVIHPMMMRSQRKTCHTVVLPRTIILKF